MRQGGLESGLKNVTIAQKFCPNWYAENEWDVNFFGAYAFTTNASDRYLEVDHGFGGGIATRELLAQITGSAPRITH